MRILHLTDLHMGWIADADQEREHWDRFCRAIESACRVRPVNMAALTGDFGKTGSREEFERAGRALDQLAHILGIRRDHFFFCRGNHDSDTIYAGSSFRNYQQFLDGFYGAGQAPDQGVITSEGVQVFSLNCCKKTSLARFDDAWLDKADIDEVLELAEAAGGSGVFRKSGSSDGEEGPEPIRILLHHHQPEILADQSQMKRLGDSGLFACMLSGHLHCYARKYEWQGLTVINGMAVTPHLDFLPGGFQIIELEAPRQVRAWGYADTGKDEFLEYEIK